MSRQHQIYRVGPMMTQTSVAWAFSNVALTRDPEYVKAVIRSYVQAKAANGRPKSEIGYKLEYIEEEWPQYAPSFITVRQEYGLAPSRVLRLPRATPASTVSPLRRAQTSTTSSPSSARPANNYPGISRTRTTAGATTIRPAVSDDTEPPPPPYTSQDPEPEATRMLQERLAAEAEATSSVTPIESVQPSSTAPLPTRTPSITSPRPASVRNTSTSQTNNHRTSTATPSRTSIDQAPAPQPSDPEMARVWEESQLSEAKRASLAWQREQEELQEAMRLSLAETESPGHSVAGPSGSGSQMSPVEEEPSNPRRVSSYHPLATAQANPHRRVASDANAGLLNEPVIPGAWQGSSRPISNIIDQSDDISFAQAPITPNKTGHTLQSNNPFLSPTEREHLQAEENRPQSASSGQHSALDDLADLQIGETAPSQHYQNPGSSYTQYNANTTEQYAPPPGLPPPHLQIASPPSPKVNRPLPRTPSASNSAPMEGQTPMSPPVLPPRPAQNKLASLQQEGGEDPLDMLKNFDTVFLVDDSTSMAGERWSQARAAIMEVAEIAAKYDEDGVDVYFINSKRVGKELKAAPDVEDLFRGLEPKGATPTGLRLEAILRDYIGRLERSLIVSPGIDGQPPDAVKPMNLIVVTDGVFAHPVLARKRALAFDSTFDRVTLVESAPTDDPESVLITCAKRLDKGDFPLSQVGVQFLQIGDDAEAREALEELDDGLASAHGVRDMVDTVPHTGEEMTARLIIKTLLGGINRRLDRRSG